jgi:hypothetical protein
MSALKEAIVTNQEFDNIIRDDNSSNNNDFLKINHEVGSNDDVLVANTYMCKLCDYISSKKYNYIKHLSSVKHVKKVANIKNLYNCDICNYNTSKKYNYDKHMSSAKHSINMAIVNKNKEYEYNCNSCDYHTDKKYNYEKHMTSVTHLTNVNAVTNVNAGTNVTTFNENINENINESIKDEQQNQEELYNIKKIELQDIVSQNDINGIKNELFVSIMSEIKVMMSEQNKMIQDIAIINSNNTINNTNITNNNSK